ncbi:MAG: hypothetical protein KJ958_07000 [Gammaproteobacteria bacterium]|nr:hypothetical protein [Gammaproteobacteria bacterium]MBU1978898.1 hypothetical protein [Gammaproteobacteria bacterium]
MNKIHYDQGLSTFSRQALVVGVGFFAAQALLAISQQEMTDHANKHISGDVYRTQNNTSTYSHIGSFITGGYNRTIEKPEHFWITSELADFLLHSSQVSLEALDYLLVAIRDTYGDVQIDAALHTDPEEGWVKPVITVHSGMEDFEKLLDVEDVFFAKAENDPTLLAILSFVVVSQA